MSNSLEKKLLNPKQIEKQIEDLQYQLAEMQDAEAGKPKEDFIETNFNKLKVVLDGDEIMETEVFSRWATYDHFNLKNNQVTPMTGKQVESLFGLNKEAMKDFGKKLLGSVYRTNDFVVKFRSMRYVR